MAQYIVREAVLKIIGDNCPHDKGGYNTEEEMGAGAACSYVMKDVENIPTADVVPKSEADRLLAELEDKQFRCDSCDRIALTSAEHKFCIKQAKAEVAREIFEEIEILFSSPETPIGVIPCLASQEYEELKKKYTEGE